MSRALGLLVPYHGRVLAASAIPPDSQSDDPFLQVEPRTGSALTANPGNIVSVAASAAAGSYIRLASGVYSGKVIDFPNGTEFEPISVFPEFRASPPVFNGTTEISGTAHLFGLKFDTRNQTPSRTLKLDNFTNGVIAYCDFQPFALGVEVLDGCTFPRFHRCHFRNQSGSVENGGEALKLGEKDSLNVNLGVLVDLCLIEDFTAERETISFKCRGARVFRCVIRRCKEIGFRHAQLCTVEQCDIDNKISIHGPDHQVISCNATEIRVLRGTHDGDTILQGVSAVRLASKRVKVSRNNASIEIGGLPFSTSTQAEYPDNAKFTEIFGNVGSVTDMGESTFNSSLPFVRVNPPQLNSAAVGIPAYQSFVTEPS